MEYNIKNLQGEKHTEDIWKYMIDKRVISRIHQLVPVRKRQTNKKKLGKGCEHAIYRKRNTKG